MSRTRPGYGLPVLTYHGFGPRRTVTTTERSWFAETIAALLDAGFRGVDLDDWVARGRPDEPRGFALAFDDGLASVLSVVDVVTRHALPATVFLVTDRVGRDNDWPGQPAFVPRERLLDGSEVRDLARLGFRFGAHGRTHARLDGRGAAWLDHELRGSRDAVESAVGRPCGLVAYPYGTADGRARRAAARHFRAAFGTRLGYAGVADDAFALPRVDAYYLSSRSALDALARDGWRGFLRRRERLRACRRTGVALLRGALA